MSDKDITPANPGNNEPDPTTPIAPDPAAGSESAPTAPTEAAAPGPEASAAPAAGEPTPAAAAGMPGAPQGAHVPGAGSVPPGYGQYGAYGQAPSSVRGDVKRVFRHKAVQLVGAGLVGFVIGGGAVATVGAFVWDHDHSGPRWQDRGRISQQWGGGFGPGSIDGSGSANGSNGNSGSDNGSDNGGILVTP